MANSLYKLYYIDSCVELADILSRESGHAVEVGSLVNLIHGQYAPSFILEDGRRVSLEITNFLTHDNECIVYHCCVTHFAHESYVMPSSVVRFLAIKSYSFDIILLDKKEQSQEEATTEQYSAVGYDEMPF